MISIYLFKKFRQMTNYQVAEMSAFQFYMCVPILIILDEDVRIVFSFKVCRLHLQGWIVFLVDKLYPGFTDDMLLELYGLEKISYNSDSGPQTRIIKASNAKTGEVGSLFCKFDLFHRFLTNSELQIQTQWDVDWYGI